MLECIDSKAFMQESANVVCLIDCPDLKKWDLNCYRVD